MTAEMVIMNRSGVALAADSAVTIGAGNGNGSKIYNSVNKIFTLSRTHPIGVMIYGNAEYMGIPWETVIKLYRVHLGSRSFTTVVRYAEDFLRFVNREFEISQADEAMRAAQIWSGYFDDVQRHVRRTLVRMARSKPLTNDDATATFRDVLKDAVTVLRARTTLRQYQTLDVKTLFRRFKPQFDALKVSCFPGRTFTPAIDRALQEFAGLILVKEEFNHSHSGLVFAGFGDDEIFPTMYGVACVGRLLGHMKLSKDKPRIISAAHERRVHIAAFAQKEMVHRYMEGIDPHYADYLHQAVNQLVERVVDDLTAKSGRRPAQREKAKRAALRMVADLEQKAQQFRYKNYVSPLLDIVSVLPKEELAELAGALVNITSTKRKFAMEAETVGGPVDVAVISKGDGFIWIRRKHYFKPELNHAFVSQGLLNGFMQHGGE